MNNQREQWVDIARGIGIILVVCGHACCPVFPHGLIYSFHMPLFFFLAGLFIERQCKMDFLPYLKKNFRTLLIPYFFFNVISIIFYSVLSKIFLKHLLSGTIIDNFIGIFLGIRWGSLFHSELWFLPCLFSAKLLIYPLYGSGIHKEYIRLIVASVLLLLGLLYSSLGKMPLPMSLDASLVASFFIVCGNIYMKNKDYISLYVHRYIYVIIILAVSSVMANFNDVEMYEMHYGNWLYFIVGSLSLILLMCSLCQMCTEMKFSGVIINYGRLSLIVFVAHYYCLFVPITLKMRIIALPNIIVEYVYWLISTLFVLVLVLPLSLWINKNVKWLIGKW